MAEVKDTLLSDTITYEVLPTPVSLVCLGYVTCQLRAR